MADIDGGTSADTFWIRIGENFIGMVAKVEIREDADFGPIKLSTDFTAEPWQPEDGNPGNPDTRTTPEGHDIRLYGDAYIVPPPSLMWFDAAMLEQGDHPSEYFDGARFGADYIWGGDAHSSSSRHYPGRTARNARLMEILPDYLPIGQMFNLRFTEEVELGGRAAGYGALGVGHTGSMTFGE